MAKPGILVLSEDGDDAFKWVSAGWNDAKRAGSPRAQELMAKARKCISEGESVPDVIRRLEEAGFSVSRPS